MNDGALRLVIEERDARRGTPGLIEARPASAPSSGWRRRQHDAPKPRDDASRASARPVERRLAHALSALGHRRGGTRLLAASRLLACCSNLAARSTWIFFALHDVLDARPMRRNSPPSCGCSWRTRPDPDDAAHRLEQGDRQGLPCRDVVGDRTAAQSGRAPSCVAAAPRRSAPRTPPPSCTWSKTRTAITQIVISVTVMINSLASFCTGLIAWKLS